jgi:hypothetical protein
MKVVDHRQLELFSDGARAVAAGKRPPRPWPTEADLQARLDAARGAGLGGASKPSSSRR